MVKDEKNRELEALIKLIDEPNESIYGTIRERIFSYGELAIPALENAWESSFNHLIQQRIEEVIHAIQYNQVKIDLAGWRDNHQHDLLKGFMIITRFQYPDLDEDHVIKQVGRISQDVWLELNHDLTGLEKVKVINHIIFDINNYSGNRTNVTAPDNYYIKNMLETKKGNPLSLGILYAIIAQSLQLPIYGVNLPKHFILAYGSSPFRYGDVKKDSDVMFYINPFNRGAVFTRNEIELFVKQMNLSNKPEYFMPCDNLTIIQRLIEELAISYDLAGNKEKAEEMRALRTVLSRS
jgi:regulator of sirC expression with transglutaminase-like and TPR domain